MTAYTDKIATTRAELRSLYGAIPQATQAFAALGKAAKEQGVLDYKTKEFIALGISIADRCEPCITLHAEALVKAGATREEVSDVLAMAIQMGGGPAMMYAAKALACFDEFAAVQARAAG